VGEVEGTAQYPVHLTYGKCTERCPLRGSVSPSRTNTYGNDDDSRTTLAPSNTALRFAVRLFVGHFLIKDIFDNAHGHNRIVERPALFPIHTISFPDGRRRRHVRTVVRETVLPKNRRNRNRTIPYDC